MKKTTTKKTPMKKTTEKPLPRKGPRRVVPQWLLLLVILPTVAVAQEPTRIPNWFLEHIEFMTRDDGRWIASNEPYRSEQDPIDSYVLVWQKGIGGKGMRGRMFGIEDGAETGTFWEFRTFWHPGEQRVIAQQFAPNGVYGVGTMVSTGEGRHRMEQEFFSPDGTGFRVGHEDQENEREHVTSSFDVLSDGSWRARRTYVWQLGTD